MTKTIWKYPLRVADVQEIAMPAGAEILCVQAQGNQPCLWALVRPDEPLRVRRFCVFGTGHEVPEDIDAERYIGTAQQHGGALVWHVFEAR